MTIMDTNTKVAKLSTTFSRLVRERLSEHIEEINHRNELSRDASVCATHDFADANMIMYDAWLDVMGYDPIENTELMDREGDAEIWSAAWNVSKSAKFNN